MVNRGLRDEVAGTRTAAARRRSRQHGWSERAAAMRDSRTRRHPAETAPSSAGTARGARLTVTEGCPPGCVRAPASAQHFIRCCCCSCCCCSCCGGSGDGCCCCCGRARSGRPRFCASTHTLQGHAGSGPKILCGRDGSLPVRMRRVLGRHNRDPLFISRGWPGNIRASNFLRPEETL